MEREDMQHKGPLAFMRSPLSFLLMALLALLLLYPFFAGRVMAHAVWDICSSAILLVGIYAISHVRRHWVIAVVLAIAVLGTKWSGYIIDDERLLLVNNVLSAIFLPSPPASSWPMCSAKGP